MVKAIYQIDLLKSTKYASLKSKAKILKSKSNMPPGTL